MIAKGIVGRPVTHFLGGGAEPAEQVDSVAVEEPLEIRVATEPVAITMRTPGDDAQLALGFLFAEGIIRSIDEVGAVSHCGRPGDEGFGNVIDVTAAPGVSLDVEKVQATRRGTLTTSACGVCGRRSVDDLLSLCGQVPPGPPLSLHLVASATERLRQAQMNFARTGGVHAAAALDAQGTVLAVYEDVGRHNAVDKVVGALLQRRSVTAESALRSAARPSTEVESKPTLLVVSGRASFEILQKATMAGIALVASVSAPSSLAIDLAHRCGITLAGFVRGGGFNVYTHPERLVAEAR
ncbi:MAG TPA: formate dehydrogenase accessory sulfurtransferase FdhD [Myxococcaceae bacterium]|nr:formate dehydrogenase accessory sulfurtransferase FdhD [Myxococcaceae bacterium]